MQKIMIFKAGQLFSFKVNNTDMDLRIHNVNIKPKYIILTFFNFRKHPNYKYADEVRASYHQASLKEWYTDGIIKLINNDPNLICKKAFSK